MTSAAQPDRFCQLRHNISVTLVTFSLDPPTVSSYTHPSSTAVNISDPEDGGSMCFRNVSNIAHPTVKSTSTVNRSESMTSVMSSSDSKHGPLRKTVSFWEPENKIGAPSRQASPDTHCFNKAFDNVS
jgi:hypothetical protein